MKKITVKHCDDCPYLEIKRDKQNEFEIYECGSPEVYIIHGRRTYIYGGEHELIGSYNDFDPDIPIIIPKWCPLEDA